MPKLYTEKSGLEWETDQTQLYENIYCISYLINSVVTPFVTLPRLNCCTDCNEILHGNPLIVVVGHKLLFTVITYKHDCGVAVNS